MATKILSLLLLPIAFFGAASPWLKPSAPEEVAQSGSSSLIGGVISPLSCQIAYSETDLVAKGAQEVSVERYYYPHRLEAKRGDDYENKRALLEEWFFKKSWYCLTDTRLQINEEGEGFKVLLAQPGGTVLEFYVNGDKTELLSQYGVHNLRGETPMGSVDVRNTNITVDPSRHFIQVRLPNGTLRTYHPIDAHRVVYYVSEARLPTGHKIRYHYSSFQGEQEVRRLEGWDPSGRFCYSSIDVQGRPQESGGQTFLSSNGLTAFHRWQNFTLEAKRNKSKTWGTIAALPRVESPYDRSQTLGYNDRFLLESIDAPHQRFHCNYVYSHDRDVVFQLAFPTGEGGAYQVAHTLSYQRTIPGASPGLTRVDHSDGTATEYVISPALLFEEIRHYDTGAQLRSQKIYQWNEKQQLASLEWRDANLGTLWKRSYLYDSFGNPIEEIFTGEEISYKIERSFSQDGLHLLLKEAKEGGAETLYTYLPGTNLLTSKLTCVDGQIVRREFFQYDDVHQLRLRVTDDGKRTSVDDLSGVTERRFTRYTVRQEPPFLHMPEWIEEGYWERGEEHLLTKKHLSYDARGNVSQEEIYDANGVLAYTLYKEYNERGDLLSETNPLGQKAVYEYDRKGNLLSKTSFSGRLRETYLYDSKERLKERREIGDTSLTHTTCFEYDPQDHLLRRTDPFGLTTHFTYDRLAHQPLRTESPPILSLEGAPQPVITSATYDSLGRKLSETDGNGHTTTYRYNAYGSPTEITHPNGAKELFRYANNGDLLTHIDRSGLEIHSTYDPLGRLIQRRYLSSEGSPLGEETFRYNSLHLLSETDLEGYTTTYTYDGAGRKISEERHGRATHFAYDPLGRLHQLFQLQGALVTTYYYNLLGDLLSEEKRDATHHLLSKTSYSYDEARHLATLTRSVDEALSKTTFLYDPFGRLLEERGPSGEVTRFTYREDHLNSLGQKVLFTSKADPSGLLTETTYDPYHRIALLQKKDPQGPLLTSEQRIYDPAGNLLSLITPPQEIRFTYNELSLPATFTRAFGTPDARTTTYTYTPAGQKESEILPDGTPLLSTYDLFGRLIRLQSPHLFHTFTYDRLGRLIACTDEFQSLTLQRRYDPFGNLLEETFPNRLTLQKTYDDLNRPLTLTFPEGAIHYTYNPLYLSTVTRLSPRGKPLYTHHYNTYDLSGHPLLETLINGSELRRTYDANGRLTSLTNPSFTEHYTYDPAGNLLTRTAPASHYTYDPLSQLTQEPDHTFTYDPHQNRTTDNSAPHTHNALNELLSTPTATFTYDLNGRLLSQTSPPITYTYDDLSRLTQVETPTASITYTYDPLGRRLSKKVIPHDIFLNASFPTEEHSLYDGSHELAICTPLGTLLSLKVPGRDHSPHLPTPVAIESWGTTYTPLIDLQGSLRVLAAGDTPTYTHEYTAFGEPKTSSPIPWGYLSQHCDAETGLIYFGKRYYDPRVGRWLTLDPAGTRDSVNLYQYVLNNPFRYVDPEGEFVFAIPLFVWGAAELSLPALSVWLAPLAYGAFVGTVSYAGCKLSEAINRSVNRTSFDLEMDHFRPDYRETLPFIARERWGIPSYSAGSYSIRKEEKKVPPYDGRKLGSDPSVCPGKGFEWRGTGKPGSKEGGWYNPQTDEGLRADLDHPPPIKPHWDYQNARGEKARINTDGSVDWKED